MKEKNEKEKRNERNRIFSKRIYYPKGTELFDVWYKTYKRYKQFYIELEIKGSNGIYYSDYFYCFEYKNNIYAEVGINHFNAHINNFHDNKLIYGVYLRKIFNSYIYKNHVKKLTINY